MVFLALNFNYRIIRTMHDITQLWGMCIIGKEEEEG